MTVETIEVTPTLRVRIEIDEDPVNPRTDYECFGKISYMSRSKLCLGDLPVTEGGQRDIDAQVEAGDLIGIPVFAYVHSGVVLKAAQTNPFACPWDSGRSGTAFVEVSKALQEFNATALTQEVKGKAIDLLVAEVEHFSHYLGGDCYGYVIERLTLDDDGDIDGIEELDSCWGFVGDVSYVCQEALAAAEHFKQAVDAA